MTPTAATLAHRLALLSGASLLALASPALAGQPISGFRTQGGAALAAGPGAVMAAQAGSGLPPGAAQQMQLQQSGRARAATAADIAAQAQVAARAANARSLTGPVPNGLGLGALNPAVTAPQTAALDPTGTMTWQGASMPTQVANAQGGYDVTIDQTDPQAVLSWTSFNIGRQTSLTFDQQGNASWIVLNRVVGQLDPATGRRNPNLAPAPSQILGSIHADGQVLVINQNGIVFGPTAQINVNALIATSLEIGQPDANPGSSDNSPRTLQARNIQFLTDGILGAADQGVSSTDFSYQGLGTGISVPAEPELEGPVTVEAGAQITTNSGGLILLAAPQVDNAGLLSAPTGQVILASGRMIGLTRSDGSGSDIVRGLTVTTAGAPGEPSNDSVHNEASGLIEAPQGNITLVATSGSLIGADSVSDGALVGGGAVVNDGVLTSTTTVSHNGSIIVSGADVSLSPRSVIAVTPDDSPETIPQDAASIAAFKPSAISIGGAQSNIDVGAGALVLAPGGNISLGARAGNSIGDDHNIIPGAGQVFIDSGATIDASGVADVVVPATQNQIVISPVKGNETADTPTDRSVLNGATVYVDPRDSGVRADGVAWIGTPLLDAASYYAQVGVTASQLLTKGGNITIAGTSWNQVGGTAQAPDVIVKPGAVLDVAGGWVHYTAGSVRTTQLVTPDGHRVDIADADPDQVYVGVAAQGDVTDHPHWGYSQSFVSMFNSGLHVAPDYIEGRDAGSLTVSGSTIALDGTIDGEAFAGPFQRAAGRVGTGTATVAGDLRSVQGAASELPSGGMLLVDDSFAGGDIEVLADSDIPSLPAGLAYDQPLSFAADGSLVRSPLPSTNMLPDSRLDQVLLSANALSNAGLSQVSLHTAGDFLLSAIADIQLQPGGVFDVVTGRRALVVGDITVPSGKISIQTTQGAGSVFASPLGGPGFVGEYDAIIIGKLSTRGLWVNDYNLSAAEETGGAYLNGGSVSIAVAPRVSDASVAASTGVHDTSSTATDYSGSILIDPQAVIDVSGGGRVTQTGALQLTAKGGDVSLIDETTYFQLDYTDNPVSAVNQNGFRVAGLKDLDGGDYIPVNPAEITSQVSFDPASIIAQGFGGGGTFTLATPLVAFGSTAPAGVTALPLDFFSKAGFAAYDITSYKTDFISNPFTNGLGGYDALFQVQALALTAGQTLNLTQSVLPNHPDAATAAALRMLGTGGDVRSIVSAAVPDAPYDQLPVSLTLSGVELHVDQGASIVGAAGSAITASQIWNEGTIRLPGGVITSLFTAPGPGLGIHDLDDAFTVNDDGSIDESADAKIQLSGPTTNVELLDSGMNFFLLADLDENEGIRLSAGSVTDLSGEVLLDPRPTLIRGGTMQAGRVVDGGTLQVAPDSTSMIFHPQPSSPYDGTTRSQSAVQAYSVAQAIVLQPGASLDLSGTSGVLDMPAASSGMFDHSGGYAPTPVWSNAGSLIAPGGLSFGDGAVVRAFGGSPQALGGTLDINDLVLTDKLGDGPDGAIAASQITGSGFDTLIARGSLSSSGDVSLTLGRGFFLYSLPFADSFLPQDFSPIAGVALTAGFSRSFTGPTAIATDGLDPVIKSTGGSLSISAPYIRFDSNGYDLIDTSAAGTVPKSGPGSVAFSADQIDFSGALLIDRSVDAAHFTASGDITFSGVEPYQLTYEPAASAGVAPALNGAIAAANGSLFFTADRMYPTTGSSFVISSAAPDGIIFFRQPDGSTSTTPYSAGGSLSVYASDIVQDGSIYAPLGNIRLGSSSAYAPGDGTTTFAPPSQNVELGAGGVTSVSADGLSIPYGTTTDGVEWFFTPTSTDALTAPPAGGVALTGTRIDVASGATVDLAGGGDVYAYEFVPGTGGSRDVLSQTNPDTSSSTTGFTYPGGQQPYAIVPGLSAAQAAAYDPIYSANYSALGGPSQAGLQVYLNGAPGLAAGYYTLLPAQYATLPGGMLVVPRGSTAVRPDLGVKQLDGTLLTAGRYTVAGTGAEDSTWTEFAVEPQSVFETYSKITLTSGDAYFANLAVQHNEVTPRLPIDAGRLVLTPAASMTLAGTLSAAAGPGGRGGQVDISGTNLDIVSSLPAVDPADGVIRITADSLTHLNAESLLIGGVRTDNADGTTSLDVTAQTLAIDNDAAHPLVAPEIVLAVDDLTTNPATGAVTAASSLTLADGAAVLATGVLSDTRTGDYTIFAHDVTVSVNGAATAVHPVDTGRGAVLRVANGPERLVTRLTDDTTPAAPAATLAVGAAALSGQALLMSSSDDFTLSDQAALNAQSLALGAAEISFSPSAKGLSGLVITPSLQAAFGQASKLTLVSQAPVGFAGGAYTFGQTIIDAPGLEGLGGGAVSIAATDLSLRNSGADAGACDVAFACGNGQLSIATGALILGPGVVRAYGFDAGVDITATTGVFALGTGSLDVGAADLTLATPYLGDRTDPDAAPPANGAAPALNALTLATTGKLTIAGPGVPATAPTPGLPGTKLTLDAASVAISGTLIHATAGTVDIESQGPISLTGGAVIEAPGYSHDFGDSADPYPVDAPAGSVILSAKSGDLTLAAGTSLLVGSPTGTGGSVSLTAANGQVLVDGTLDAGAPQGGGDLTIDTLGSIDLAGLGLSGGAHGFTGAIDIHTRKGDLVLAAGQSLTAADIDLTADGGQVDLAGTLDAAGTDGGQVQLYGRAGVHLESTAVIDAHADGYGSTDTRQAHGGQVILGVEDDGAINIDAGALIDVSAAHPGDRLVPLLENGVTDYQYVQGDLGGVVQLRAPVSSFGTVDVTVADASSVRGASQVVLRGVKAFDLSSLIGVPGSGVTLDSANGAAVLDPTGSYLSDPTQAGGIVPFIQDFDLSGSYAGLGGLAALPGFVARPEVELSYFGAIELNRNWNLAAGTVNQAGALAAGLMGTVNYAGATGPASYNYVVPGDEAAVFSQFTTMLYRVGGSVAGAAPVIDLEAGAGLTINASINDGFFQFRNQTDPLFLGENVKVVSFQVGGVTTGAATTTFQGPNFSTAVPTSRSTTVGGDTIVFAPYDADGNSVSPDKVGDPFGTDDIFPLLPGGAVAGSSDLILVAGADRVLAGGKLGPSVNPGAVHAGSNANLIVQGQYDYALSQTSNVVQYDDLFSSTLTTAITSSSSADTWVQDVTGKGVTVANTSGSQVFFGTAATNSPANQAMLIGPHAQTNDPSDLIYLNISLTPGTGVLPTGPLSNVSLRDLAKSGADPYLAALYNSNATTPTASGDFFTVASVSSAIVPSQATSAQNASIRIVASLKTAQYIFQTYIEPLIPATAPPATTAGAASVSSLIRTGVGSIALAASGDINLQNGAAPTYRTAAGQPATSGAQLGGALVYTAGHPVDPITETLPDPLTGAPVSVNIGANLPATNIDANLRGTVIDRPGVLAENLAFLEGGGDVSLNAGGDILSRRNTLFADQANTHVNPIGFLGNQDQPWRAGTVGGGVTTIGVNPQAFSDGVGALGGGDVSVKAGGDIVDLNTVADNSVLTATVKSADGLIDTQALAGFGSGNVLVSSGGSLVGGRLDVASGAARIQVAGNVASAGQVGVIGSGADTFISGDNLYRIRITDASVQLSAGGDIELGGIGSLGPQQIQNGNSGPMAASQNAQGFYSNIAGVSLLADGSIHIDNNDNAVNDTDISQGNAVYPGSLAAIALTGDLDIVTKPVQQLISTLPPAALLYPSTIGQLELIAGNNILPTNIAMLDADTGLLPGAFGSGVVPFAFPDVTPGGAVVQYGLQHNRDITHQDDPDPVRVYAGADIGSTDGGLILSVPKAARIGAGEDIVNMMFFGQNVSDTDITRIVAGRDITATSQLVQSEVASGLGSVVSGSFLPAVQGNTFVIGGPGEFDLEAGRNLGPFLNSGTTVPPVLGGAQATRTYYGGIISVGNSLNPWLPVQGANLDVFFGVGKGMDFDALREAYLNPANQAGWADYLFQQVDINSVDVSGKVADRTQPIYGPVLIAWMQQNQAKALTAAYGTTNVTFAQAYAAFAALPELVQRPLLESVYFEELRETSDPNGPSLDQYARGYTAVNTLFPASLGYTQNNLSGGSNGANAPVVTGNLDLRLAAIETVWGGDVNIFGPGGEMLVGSTVRTADQISRRNYVAPFLFDPGTDTNGASSILSIPAGNEGVLTIRGGTINTFTDGSLLLNQSRVFTEQGGAITMWSSNGDLNAGQGPKTSSDFPPVVLDIDQNLFGQEDQSRSVTGAGIAAFNPTVDAPPPNVYLIAPRGTVDAGDAGVRVAGDLFVAAAHVANADNFQVAGKSFGIPTPPVVNVAANLAASNTAAQAEQILSQQSKRPLQVIITVEVVGFGDDGGAGQ